LVLLLIHDQETHFLDATLSKSLALRLALQSLCTQHLLCKLWG
jgi:hypothetical protein